MATRLELRRRVGECRRRVLGWLDANRVEGLPGVVKRESDAHDPKRWPGMLLPGTYNATHCLVLLGRYPEGDPMRVAGVDFINSFQTGSGAYRIPEMRGEEVFKRKDSAETWEYIDFHTSNYALGAVEALGGLPARTLAFVDSYLEAEGLARWLASRSMDDPWLEGNNIVNLGGFLIHEASAGRSEAPARIGELLAWLDKTQDPHTGFWGTDLSTRRGLLHGMAGAMHSYHLYYHEGRFPPRLDRIAEVCLSLARSELSGVSSACLDLDIIDVLANVYAGGHRRAEIEDYLEKKLRALLAFQNADGGFADERTGVRRFDGWVRGYEEPGGISNCFATWFRTAAIGMAACVLFPESTADWHFRSTVGIGYFPTREGLS